MYSQITSNKRRSALLMIIFVILIIALGLVFDLAFYGEGSYVGLAFALIISTVSATVSYFKGDKIALWTNGAKPLAKEASPYLYRLVENLCITGGTPVPKIYIIEDPAINAFATGRKPELASIAVTRGALDQLQNEELEGVLAHELSHIKNYDIRFMTLVAVMVGAIAIMSNIFLRGHRFMGGSGRKNSGNLFLVFMIIGIVLAILSPLIAEMIKLAISRRREYLADASGSLLTRFPEGLARALEKIRDHNQPMARANQATAHLFIASPFSGKKLSSFFSTHPPVEDRIKKLRGMA